MAPTYFNLFIFQNIDAKLTFLVSDILSLALDDSSEAILTEAQTCLGELHEVNTGDADSPPIWEFYMPLSNTKSPYLKAEASAALADTIDRSSVTLIQDKKTYYRILPDENKTIEVLLEDRRQIFCVFSIPPSSRRSSRGLHPIREDPGDRAAIVQAAIKQEAPSTVAKTENWVKHQKPTNIDAAYDGRPYPALQPSPILIYHPIFTQFLDELSKPAPGWNIDDEENKDLFMAIDFHRHMMGHYESKLIRQKKLSALNNLLGRNGVINTHEISISETRSGTPDRTIKPDGYAVWNEAQDRVTTLVTELKNELGDGGCDPLARALCVYMGIWADYQTKRYRLSSCCPAFILILVGPYVLVVGVIFADRFICQHLTNLIHVDPGAGGGSKKKGIFTLAHLFRSLRHSLDSLDQYYKGLPALPNQLSSSSPTCGGSLDQLIPPSFSEFKIDEKEAKLSYRRRLLPSQFDRPIFEARLDYGGQNHRVVVKFVKAYPETAHQYLSKLDPPLAPKIWHFEELKDAKGWSVVVMEYVNAVRPTPDNKDLLIRRLREAVRILHDDKLVHGDLRNPNILPTDDGMRLIDFDWVAQEGIARYPIDLNTDSSIHWPPGVRRGGKITREHDQFMLGKYEEYVERMCDPPSRIRSP